jgi:hypothetical protein
MFEVYVDDDASLDDYVDDDTASKTHVKDVASSLYWWVTAALFAAGGALMLFVVRDQAAGAGLRNSHSVPPL